jgi:hypothetical protein
MTAMLERIQSDTGVPKVSGSTPRADLAVSPAPASSETRGKAVAPVAPPQRAVTDEDVLHSTTHLIGQVRSEFAAIEAADEAEKQLEELYAKLFSGYQAMVKGEASADQMEQAAQAADAVDVMANRILGEQASAEKAASENTAGDIFQQQVRERTIARIETALRRVGQLRDKLATNRSDAHTRLLNINSSVSGLNMALSQADSSNFGVYSASSTYDAVMLNLRNAVVAHRNVSPDIVRLILN